MKTIELLIARLEVIANSPRVSAKIRKAAKAQADGYRMAFDAKAQEAR